MYGKIGANTLRLLRDPSLIKQGVSVIKETGIKNIIKNQQMFSHLLLQCMKQSFGEMHIQNQNSNSHGKLQNIL